MQTIQWTNQNSQQTHVAGTKRGKAKWRETISQSQSVTMQKKKTKEIAKLLSALNWKPYLCH